MKTTIIKQSSYKVNYGDGMPLLVEVALYRIEKTIFSRPTPPYYIEVRNNGYISQEFLSEDWAIKKFMEISAFWFFEEMRNNLINRDGNFMQYILSLNKENIYKAFLGLSFSLAGFRYNEITNDFTAYLIDNGNIANEVKYLGINPIQIRDADNIVWKLTNYSVQFCRITVDDKDFPYSTIKDEVILYAYPEYNNPFQIMAYHIKQSLGEMNPTKCKVLYSDCKL